MPNSGNSKIAITGASGFIGRYLVAELREIGFSVIGISRGECGDRQVKGSVTSTDSWIDVLSGVDVVIHCAAVTAAESDCRGDQGHVFQVNCDMTAAVARACIQSGVRRFIFISSAKVYGESSAGRSPYSETDPLDPQDAYGVSKARAEKLLSGISGRGLDVVCLRLPLVYGPGAKANLRKLQFFAKSRWPLPLASIRNKRSVLGLNNMAKVVALLLNRNHWPDFVLNVADPQSVSTPELIRILGGAKGGAPWLVPFPVFALKMLGVVVRRQDVIRRLVDNLEVSTERLMALVEQRELDSTLDSAIRLLSANREGL